MTPGEWWIPPAVVHWLAEVPRDKPVAALVRHSVRGPLPPGEAGNGVPITEVGAGLARELGAMIGGRLRSLHTSPLIRCVQTAEGLRTGASVTVPIAADRLLGHPGVYVVDGIRAGLIWDARGHEAVMEHLVSQDGALPGMADPDPAARFLVQHMLAAAGDEPGLHIFVTHDSLVTTTAARLLGHHLGKDAWPWYLEGAFFWRDAGHVWTAYRDRSGHNGRAPLCALDERDVIDFARREIAMTVGVDCSARFFLAGGAFKSLLTGRPPRDLDLWAPSAGDRERLLAALARRGAHRLDDRPFAEAFQLGERVVEVPRKVEPASLEGRLARFDIALSAVGVEHRPGDRWQARIHPLARKSVERRAVLLLKPLVNWKHALTTLERLRRYADALGFSVPPGEEDAVWRVFESQSRDMRLGMLERFDQTAVGGYGVREEATCRLR